jgi:hypothetical protein
VRTYAPRSTFADLHCTAIPPRLTASFDVMERDTGERDVGWPCW